MRSNSASQAGKKAGGATLNLAQEFGKKWVMSSDIKIVGAKAASLNLENIFKP
ncbi:MAG: hypothetical protein ACFNTA_06445 [Campylobacter sp.]|uniref:hypothetical protein n=1 Tax=Campylobacter sp. TaxID=205 RepID=UPI00361A1BD2